VASVRVVIAVPLAVHVDHPYRPARRMISWTTFPSIKTESKKLKQNRPDQADTARTGGRASLRRGGNAQRRQEGETGQGPRQGCPGEVGAVFGVKPGRHMPGILPEEQMPHGFGFGMISC